VGGVCCKRAPCWLWHTINHGTGEIIVYVFGTREHEVLQKLLVLLSNLNVEIMQVFCDDILLIVMLYLKVFCVQVSVIRNVLSASI